MAVAVGDLVFITGSPGGMETGGGARATGPSIAYVTAVADGNGNVKCSTIDGRPVLIPATSITGKLTPVAP